MSHNIVVPGGATVRLPTAGKYCDRDIVVTAEGGGLSLDVVTASSLPGTVVDGQIVVITGTAPGTAYIDTDEPGSPAVGDVWVVVGGGAKVDLVLTAEAPYFSNGLASAREWNGTDWDIRKGYLGVSGEWKQFSVDMPSVGTPLNDMTWDQVSAISTKGLATNYFAVGDAKEITISGQVGKTTFNGLKLWAYVIGIDHNSDKEGKNTVHFQIGKMGQTSSTRLALVDSKYNQYITEPGYFSFNTSKTNAGGWAVSAMRTTVLGSDSDPKNPTGGTLLSALPVDLRNVMRGVTKYTDNKGSKSNTDAGISATTEYLWLLAEYEVLGLRAYANTYEKNYQKQYAFYSAGNDKKCYKHNATSDIATWWLRSPDYNTNTNFCDIYTNGGQDNSPGDYCNALAPAFCV